MRQAISVPLRLENTFLQAADTIFRFYPHTRPAAERLAEGRIVSHRGEHDNRRVLENTMPALRAAVAGGVWGIEFDVRWTSDSRPVVIHDPDTRRLFGRSIRIAQASRRDLIDACPLIPSLAEVLQAFGRRAHLMIELKSEGFRDVAGQRRILAEHLENLTPGDDFHLISLTPEVLEVFDFVPPAARLPIAQANVRTMSRLAVSKSYGGLLGHYLMVTAAVVKRHHTRGQPVGTGFVDSVNCLFREVNRNIDWLFSNRAVALQSVVDEARRQLAPGTRPAVG